MSISYFDNEKAQLLGFFVALHSQQVSNLK